MVKALVAFAAKLRQLAKWHLDSVAQWLSMWLAIRQATSYTLDPRAPGSSSGLVAYAQFPVRPERLNS